MRRPGIAASIAVVVATSLLPTASNAAPPAVPDFLRAYSIIPAGQSGFVNGPQALSGVFGPHVTDQLDMYASLIDDDDVTEAEMSTYFHDFQFGPVGSVEREYSPRPGVTVFRDSWGIPRIYGDTDADAAFALGYVTAEDRLWHMDLLRRAGKGRLSEFLGDDLLAFDKQTRRDGYSEAELQQMIDGLDEDFGSAGAKVQEGVAAYADGVNARIAEVRADSSLKPVEYVVQGLPIEDWTPTDTVATAVLQLRSFGETSGGELRNAALYQELRRRLGKRLGTQVFDDLVWTNDDNAYTTIPPSEGRFPAQKLGSVDPASVAIPDNATKTFKSLAVRDRRYNRSLRALRLHMPSSNFLAVAPSESTTGNTLEFGAPQVGYSIPQFFMDIEVHSPSLDFRGPAVPGASLLVPVGRGIDYAWSLTTGVSDAVDTRVELLCNPGGEKVAKSADHYVFKGKCKAMTSRTETFAIKGGSEDSLEILRTVHGPVIDRATVGGDPVALVRERHFWMHEIDTIPAFYEVNSNAMDSVEEFAAAMAKMTMSFNAVYADAEHIGYFHVGSYPLRHKGVDPKLPTWGTGQWEWTGSVDFADQPQMIDPAQGWIANWNNKPATGWNDGDSTFWGPTHRVRLLSDSMGALLEGAGTATLSDLVDVIRDAATRDARAAFIGASMVDYAEATSGTDAAARDAVAGWIAAGSHRFDRNADQLQDSGTAVAVFDTWYADLIHRVFDDELQDDYELLGLPISDDASENNGSSYFSDFSNYLSNLFNENTRDDYARDYCDDITTAKAESCKLQARKALTAAVAQLTADQGADPATWTWPADYIEFDVVGAAEVDPIPWQNRGTYNHAVEVTGSR